MDSFISTVAQLKASGDTKYDVLYLNTPWNKLSVEQLGRIDLACLTTDEALMFMWADTYTMQDAIELFKIQGFTFESVYQVCDTAIYPSCPVADSSAKTSKSPKPTGASQPIQVPQPSEADAAPDAAPDDKASVRKISRRAKKQRCPPLSLPAYWKIVESKGSTRPTTEYLLLGYKGGRDVLDKLANEKAGTLPYQVVRRPDLGKKSRSVPKKNVSLDPEWVCDRPDEFLDSVAAHLEPSAKILEVFGSTLRNKTDSIGPNVPGGFCQGYANNVGIANCLNNAMRSMRKAQLQALCAGLAKMGQADTREAKVKEFKVVEQTWNDIVMSLVDMKSPVSYDWSSEDPELPVEWLRLMILSFAQKNTADFGSLRRKRKKRKTNNDSPRACHGIAKPVAVSSELTAFLGLDDGQMISRTHTVKLLNNYVKANGLQNPAKKIEIIPDEPLLKLLNPPADFGPITYFKMCSLLGPHFPKEAKEANEANEAEGGAAAGVELREPVTKKAKKSKIVNQQS